MRSNIFFVLASVLIMVLSSFGISLSAVPYESFLPQRTIIVDGDPSDWVGVPTFLTDVQGDSVCEPGTDVKAFYLAKDDSFLYWRLDTWSGTFFFDNQKFPQIVFSDGSSIVNGQTIGFVYVTVSPNEAYAGVVNNYPEYDLSDGVGGPEYGQIGQVAEGKIPLLFFEGLDIDIISAYYHLMSSEDVCDGIRRDTVFFKIVHMIHEDGRDNYKLLFSFLDSEWQDYDYDILKNFKLVFDPENGPIEILTDQVSWMNFPGYFSKYKPETNSFNFFTTTFFGYEGVIDPPISDGKFQLTAEVNLPLEIPYIEQAKRINLNIAGYGLPILPSDSIQVSNDDGNFIATWDAPQGMNELATSCFSIRSFSGQNQIGSIYVKMPADLGRVEIPASVIEDFETWGGSRYDILLQLRSSDDVKRTYSRIDLPSLHVKDPVSVYLDIKPGSCHNPLNVKSRGKLPVAILGNENLDAAMIDPVTIRLEGVAPLHSRIKDVCIAYNCDVDGPDGFPDLTLKFGTQDIVEALGEVADGDLITLKLKGKLMDGTAIEGEDVVLILKKGKGKKR